MAKAKEPKTPKEIKILDDGTLKKLSTGRLVNILRIVHARISYIHNYYGRRCCEECLEYIGDDWEKDVAQYSRPFVEYKARLKELLSNREDLGEKKPCWRRVTKRHRSSPRKR